MRSTFRLGVKLLRNRGHFYIELAVFTFLAELLTLGLFYLFAGGSTPLSFSVFVAAWMAMGASVLDLRGGKRILSFFNSAGVVPAFYAASFRFARVMFWPLYLIEKESWEELLHSVKFLVYVALGLMLFSFSANATPLSDLSPILRELHSGVLPLLIAAATLIAFLKALTGSLKRVWDAGLRYFVVIVLFDALYKNLGGWLDTLVSSAAAEPETILTLVATFFLLYLSYRTVFIFDRLTSSPGRAPVSAGSSAAIVSLPPPITDRDERVMAVHEAGHVLAYALCGRSEKPFASIQPDGKSLGRVNTDTPSFDNLLTQSELEWYMILSLAGRAAELALLGEAYSGSTGDMRKWSHHAYVYLDNRFGSDPFYTDDPTEGERQLNADTLSKLKARHMEYLANAFGQNRALLDDLARTLQKEKEMGAADLQPFLDRFDIPSELPCQSV